jgi:multicomponent K+:H+ antiporter subunit G
MTPLPPWLDVLAALLVLAGAVTALLGSFALVKFSDFMKRLHGPTKASTLGMGCVLVASMLSSAGAGEASLRELLITLFVFLTAPVSAQLLVKAAMRQDPRIVPPGPPGRSASADGERKDIPPR